MIIIALTSKWQKFQENVKMVLKLTTYIYFLFLNKRLFKFVLAGIEFGGKSRVQLIL